MRPRGNTFIQAIQLYDKYARWRPEDQRRETWAEAVDRVMAFLQQQPRANVLTPEVWAQLRTALEAWRGRGGPVDEDGRRFLLSLTLPILKPGRDPPF